MSNLPPSHPTLRRRTVLASMGAALSPAFLPAFAQEGQYPQKVVKIVVPSAPGGSLDAMARVLSQRLGVLWNQTVVVENRLGANFTLGTSYVVQSPADGYTLLYAHDGVMSQNPALYTNLPYNPLTDLTPIARVVTLPPFLFVRSNLPYANLQDFVQAIRAQPGKFNNANGGPAATFISELMKSVGKLEYLDIAYKGAALALTAVAAGECDFTFADMGTAVGLLGTGRIRPLGVCTPARLKKQPAVPAIAEVIPGFEVVSWSGLIAPAKTPPDVIRKISSSLQTIAGMPDARRQVESLGLEFDLSTPEEIDATNRNDLRKWSKLVKDRNIQPL